MNDLRRIAAVCALAAAAGCTTTWESHRDAVPDESRASTPSSAPAAPGAASAPVFQPTAAAPAPAVQASDAVAATHFETLLNACAAKVAAAKDMTCRLVRTEMVGDRLQPMEELDFRQRFAPHALRLKWVGRRFKNRELIYAVGKNDGNVLVKEPGLGGLLTGGRPMSLALVNPLIKNASRYGPDVAGYNNLVARLVKLYRDSRPIGLAWVAESPVVAANGRRTQTFTVTRETLLLDDDVSRMEITFDLGTLLVARSVLHDAKKRMAEDYDWQSLRLNARLTDADFRF
jgi:hypothetical protein